MRRLRDCSRGNLELAKSYLQAKLLAIGLLEAVSAVSGGDAPVALFMGDLPQDCSGCEDIISFLPPMPESPWILPDDPLYRLLKDGRLDDSSFDLKNSPLALYLFHRLSPEARASAFEGLEGFFAARLSAADFLMGFEARFLSEFLEACARMVPTRKAALEAW